MDYSIYQDLQKEEMNIYNHPDIIPLLGRPEALKRGAQSTRSAFRVNGVTYYYKEK